MLWTCSAHLEEISGRSADERTHRGHGGYGCRDDNKNSIISCVHELLVASASLWTGSVKRSFTCKARQVLAKTCGCPIEVDLLLSCQSLVNKEQEAVRKATASAMSTQRGLHPLGHDRTKRDVTRHATSWPICHKVSLLLQPHGLLPQRDIAQLRALNEQGHTEKAQ